MSTPASPKSHAFTSQRLRLQYVDWGNPEAPPLLLVHGGRDHARSWDWVAQALRRDWHVLAPDLRGHGDSAWSPDGHYEISAFVYDLAQLIHQRTSSRVTLIGHSLGGVIALRYAGVFSANVHKLIAIEGLGLSPRLLAERKSIPVARRVEGWIKGLRDMATRIPKRYRTIDDAITRMQQGNPNLSLDQARHLTEHGVQQNEDDSYSWKFDNYIRLMALTDLTADEVHELWSAISCPTLLIYGTQSGASNPLVDGRAENFRNARVTTIDGAGHWVHHDRQEAFLDAASRFLAETGSLS